MGLGERERERKREKEREEKERFGGVEEEEPEDCDGQWGLKKKNQRNVVTNGIEEEEPKFELIR